MKFLKLIIFCALFGQSELSAAMCKDSWQSSRSEGNRGEALSPELATGNKFKMMANSEVNTISVYEVDQSTGKLKEVPGSPFHTGVNPVSVAFSPVVAGNLFAAVACDASNNVHFYHVNQTTGTFTQVAGNPFHTKYKPLDVIFSLGKSGELFLAVPGKDKVSIYSVNQVTGAITPVDGSPFPTRGKSIDEVLLKICKPASDPEVIEKLFALVVKGKAKELPGFFKEHNLDVDAENVSGVTALNVAVQNNQIHVVQVLLELGADPETADILIGFTPLKWAELKENKKMQAILKKAIEDKQKKKKQE